MAFKQIDASGGLDEIGDHHTRTRDEDECENNEKSHRAHVEKEAEQRASLFFEFEALLASLFGSDEQRNIESFAKNAGAQAIGEAVR